VIHGADRRVLGLNIELITDRDLQTNPDERITRVKKDYPDRAMIVSIMVPCEEQAWKDILPKVEATVPMASS
jgi:dihydropyrimidine dehydrogenase (NAD+) subunit PreA